MVIERKGQPMLDSREVAEMCELEHSKLLRKIDDISQSLGKSKIGFTDLWQETTYTDVQNKQRKMFEVTKKGCEFIANKLTGDKGNAFTYKYVTRFNQMENYLINTGLINELRTELTSSIDSIVNERIQQIESKCSQY